MDTADKYQNRRCPVCNCTHRAGRAVQSDSRMEGIDVDYEMADYTFDRQCSHCADLCIDTNGKEEMDRGDLLPDCLCWLSL